MYDLKLAAGIIASLLALVAYAPYIRDILKGKSKPHRYSWFVWGSVSMLVFFFQFNAGAGAGSYLSFSAGAICLLIFALSFKYGTKDITRSDALFLLLALIAVGVWIITNNPLISVILLSVIDLFGFIPTIRKSWSKPYTETLFTYTLGAVYLAISIYALQTYTLVTYLYPATGFLVTGLFSVMLVVRRKQVGAKKNR